MNGFSLVGPLFATKFPYPLPAVSLALYCDAQIFFNLDDIYFIGFFSVVACVFGYD